MIQIDQLLIMFEYNKVYAEKYAKSSVNITTKNVQTKKSVEERNTSDI